MADLIQEEIKKANSWPLLLCLREMEFCRQILKRYGLDVREWDRLILNVEGVRDMRDLGSGASHRQYGLLHMLVEDAAIVTAERTNEIKYARWHTFQKDRAAAFGYAMQYMEWHGIPRDKAEQLIGETEGVASILFIGKGNSKGSLRAFLGAVWAAAEQVELS